MKCPNCNKTIDEDSNFCKYCGTKVVKSNICPKGHLVPMDAKFCPDCGEPINAPSQKEEFALFVEKHVFPYWPTHGKEMTESSRTAILKAEKDIPSLRKAALSDTDKTNFVFLEQCLKALISVSHGLTPYYDMIIQKCPDFREFWLKLKNTCGDGNYNKYWLVNSGVFSDRLFDKLKQL